MIAGMLTRRLGRVPACCDLFDGTVVIGLRSVPAVSGSFRVAGAMDFTLIRR
jgi:hypothetical protein